MTKKPTRKNRMPRASPLQQLTCRVALATLLDEHQGTFRKGKKEFVLLARERFVGKNGTFRSFQPIMDQLDLCIKEQWMNEEHHGGRGRLLLLHLTDKGRTALAEHADIRATFERRGSKTPSSGSFAERALAKNKAPRVMMPREIDERLKRIEQERRVHQLALATLEVEESRLKKFKEHWVEQVNAMEHLLTIDE